MIDNDNVPKCKFSSIFFRDPLMGRRRWGLMLPALLLTVLAARLTCADPTALAKPREWLQSVCRVSHLLVDLGWVDFDLGVPPSGPTA